MILHATAEPQETSVARAAPEDLLLSGITGSRTVFRHSSSRSLRPIRRGAVTLGLWGPMDSHRPTGVPRGDALPGAASICPSGPDIHRRYEESPEHFDEPGNARDEASSQGDEPFARASEEAGG